MRPKSAPSCHTELAKVERIELSRTVLETAALPLSYTNMEVWVRFELTTLRICNPFPWATRAPHRIKKPSKIFIWEGSLIRYIFDIRYIEPPHMRIYSPQSGVINQFCVWLCESFICNRVPLFVLLLYSTLLL